MGDRLVGFLVWNCYEAGQVNSILGDDGDPKRKRIPTEGSAE